MYAVFTEGRLSYLGECQTKALNAFNDKPNSTLHRIESHSELEDLIFEHEDDTEDQAASEAFETIVNKLDELGINEELVDRVRDNGAKLVGEAKSLGARGMKAVGEGFVALGELLRNASHDEVEDLGPCEKGEHCCRHQGPQAE